MRTVLTSVAVIISIFLLSIILVSIIQPLHIPFLGDVDQQDVDRAITTFLLTGNEEQIDFLTPNEQSHMHDVKVLLDLGILILLTLIIGLVLTYDQHVFKRIRFVPLLAAVVLGILSLTPFTTLFAQFHEVVFPQGNYTFPFDSILIQTYPESFFQMMFVLIIVIYLVLSIWFMRMHKIMIRHIQQ